MNKLQQIILDVLEEMDVGGVIGYLPSTSQASDGINNTDSYSTNYHGLPYVMSVQKRKFPELMHNLSKTNKKTKKRKKLKNGKQK